MVIDARSVAVRTIFGGTAALAAVLMLPLSVSATEESEQASLSNNLAQRELRFQQNPWEGNRADVLYGAAGLGYSIQLTPAGEARLVVPTEGDSGDIEGAVTFGIRLEGGQVPSAVKAGERLPGVSHYYVGNDESQWRENVPSFDSVRYSNVYPGIDVVYRGNQKRLQYDFVVAPGADPAAIELAFRDIDTVEVASGALKLSAGDSLLLQHAPVIYQDIDGQRIFIDGGYLPSDDSKVRFEVASYDPEHDLVIDPTLTLASYVGGESRDNITGVAIDSSGRIILTGSTMSTPFLSGGFNNGAPDAFVTRLSADGEIEQFTTLLGTISPENGGAAGRYLAESRPGRVAVDNNNNIYVTGSTAKGVAFPSKNASLFESPSGAYDVFFARLKAADGSVSVSGALGGKRSELAFGIATNGNGGWPDVVIVGATDTGSASSNDDPPLPVTANAFQTMLNGNDANRGFHSDAFVLRLAYNGSRYATDLLSYLGGSSSDKARALAVDSSGTIYVAGISMAPDGPFELPGLSGRFQDTRLGAAGSDTDGFITRITTDNEVSTTLLHSDRDDHIHGIALKNGSPDVVYVTGMTSGGGNAPFPTTQGSFQENYNAPGLTDGFVTAIDAELNGPLIFSGFLGSSNDTAIDKSDRGGEAIALDSAGNIYVAGSTSGTDFPIVSAEQRFNGGSSGSYDAFVATLDPTGSEITFSSYMGGSNDEFGDTAALREDGLGVRFVVAGEVWSDNFPVTSEAFLDTLDGQTDGMVFQFRFPSENVDSDNDDVADAADNCTALANTDQRDTDGDGFGNLCDADFDNDCVINFSDLAAISELFFQNGDLNEDMDGDGTVSFSDLALVKASLFEAPGPSGIANLCD